MVLGFKVSLDMARQISSQTKAVVTPTLITDKVTTTLLFELLRKFVMLFAISPSLVRKAPVSFIQLRSFLPSIHFITPVHCFPFVLAWSFHCLALSLPMECTRLSTTHFIHWVSLRSFLSYIHFSTIKSTRFL